MSEEKSILTAEEADRLLGAADGTAALLYLYIRRNGGFAPAAAARELKREEAEIVLAAKTLRRLGLLEQPQPPAEKREIPEYTADDIARRAVGDSGFTGIVSEAERTLGRVLSSNDLRVLFGLYDYLDSGSLCLMEWPENIEDLLPEETLRVHIAVAPAGSRIISWED